MLLQIPDASFLASTYTFLPFVRGGLRWGRVMEQAISALRTTTDTNLIFLPPLTPSYKGGGNMMNL
jgi:hypothetical protein